MSSKKALLFQGNKFFFFFSYVVCLLWVEFFSLNLIQNNSLLKLWSSQSQVHCLYLSTSAYRHQYLWTFTEKLLNCHGLIRALKSVTKLHTIGFFHDCQDQSFTWHTWLQLWRNPFIRLSIHATMHIQSKLDNEDREVLWMEKQIQLHQVT